MSAMMGDVGLTGTLIEGSIALKHSNFPKTPRRDRSHVVKRRRIELKSKILLGMKHLGGKSMKFRSAYLIAAVVVSILTIPVCSEAAGPQIRGRFSFDGLANCDNPPIRNFPIHGEAPVSCPSTAAPRSI
jgi:hypothetical protein